MTTTVARWIDLPTSGAAADRFRADQPGGAGLFQIAASNATLACRENGLRTLWEDPGSPEVYADLATPGDATTFLWSGEDAAGVYARLCGCFRVRTYGETSDAPRIHLACRAEAPAAYELGIILLVAPAVAAPGAVEGRYATATTTSSSVVPLSITLALDARALGQAPVTLRAAGAVDEAGVETELAVWVGAWCTSGAGLAKGALYGLSVLLREP